MLHCSLPLQGVLRRVLCGGSVISSASQLPFGFPVAPLVFGPGLDAVLYVDGGAEPQEERPLRRGLARTFPRSSRAAALLSSQRDLSRSSPPPLPAPTLRPLSRSRPEQCPQRGPVSKTLGARVDLRTSPTIPGPPIPRGQLSARQPLRGPCLVLPAGPGLEPEL